MVKALPKTAAIVANGAECSAALLRSVLARAAHVVVLDGAIHRVLAQQLAVDVWLGDFDSMAVPPTLPPHIRQIHTPDQNKTDLDKGLEYLIEAGYTQVYILWATGRRADHTLVNLTSLVRFQAQLDLILIDDYSVAHPIPSGFSACYPKGTQLSLIPIGTVTNAQSTGLVYNLQHDDLRLGYRTSSSNEAATDGPIQISYQSGDLLLIVAWDDPRQHQYYRATLDTAL